MPCQSHATISNGTSATWATPPPPLHLPDQRDFYVYLLRTDFDTLSVVKVAIISTHRGIDTVFNGMLVISHDAVEQGFVEKINQVRGSTSVSPVAVGDPPNASESLSLPTWG